MLKKNLLPEMQKVKMTDKDGQEFLMAIDVRQSRDLTYVFMSDTNELGTSRLAQDAMHYIRKITQRLNLNAEKTAFFRHIYQEQMGSMFGRFKVDWENDSGPSYEFHMLTNIEDLQDLGEIIESSTPVNLQEQAAARKSA